MEHNKYPYKFKDCVFRYNEKNYRWIDGEMGTLHFGKVKESDIYQVIKQHSRWIDRINPQKMYMMTTCIRDMLNIDDDKYYWQITNLPWKFYKWNGQKAHTGMDIWDDE